MNSQLNHNGEELIVDYQPRPTFLQNRVILVTGASDGIGREAALTYARYGACLILLGRTANKLQAVAQTIVDQGGSPPYCYPWDLLSSTPDDYQQLSLEIGNNISHLDGLLHNAGILGTLTPLAQQNYQQWQEVMQVNLNAPLLLTQALLPLLLKSNAASLIFTSSSVGKVARANWGAYAVSKFATEGMMQIFAQEYQHTSLRVNGINPGGTQTKMRASTFPHEDPTQLKTPAEIMSIYLYLMSDDSQGINGISFDAHPPL